MASAMELLVPIPRWIIVLVMAAAILGLQVWGSYRFIRNVFRWLALSLLAYAGAAVLAKPSLREVLLGTVVPHIHFDRQFLAMIVAVIGTTLSAYLYTWQSNEEVEEEIAMGRRRLSQRIGATDAELSASRRDVLFGMLSSSLVMYSVVLATGSTLHGAGIHEVSTAAEAARALRPVAGRWAEALFALGIVGVGVLAVPIMTIGAAYDLCQVVGWRHGLALRPHEARRFYGAIAGFTALAVALNFLGINPMKALVFSGIVQGFSTPPLMLLIMLMTNDRSIMGARVNSAGMNVLGVITLVAIFAASIGLIVSLFV
jgi:Mn2+/Fe2+ NRAMP family transporter